MNLLTYNEFQKLVRFADSTNDDKFLKFLKSSEETYLRDLIGQGMVDKLKGGDYSELMSLVKECLSLNIEVMFIETAKITVTGEGAITRSSDYTHKGNFADKEMLRKATIKLLQSYEVRLIKEIEAGDYEEWNKSKKVSSKGVFNIIDVG